MCHLMLQTNLSIEAHIILNDKYTMAEYDVLPLPFFNKEHHTTHID